MTRAWLVLALVLAACDGEPAKAIASTEPAPAARVDASDLIAKFECARCHEVPGATVAAGKSCVTCHQQIREGTFTVDGDPVDPAVMIQWRSHIKSLLWAPSLAMAGQLRRDWVRDFLLAPHDLRPGLPAEMPRLDITRDEAERIAAHLVPDEGEPTLIKADRERGAALFAEKECANCHRFTGSAFDRPTRTDLGELTALAPDLRFARDRMTRVALTERIRAPRFGVMPEFLLDESDARAIAVFIVTEPLTQQPKPPAAQRLPILARDVKWPEVEATVFRATCWHCHAEPDYAKGDGGPGNSGGFGFVGRGLDMSSYSAISAGSLDDKGERRSIFAPLPDGTPRLIAHLLARHVEEAGDAVPGIRGMPLGLPPLPLETIQLVDTWIAQGRPR